MGPLAKLTPSPRLKPLVTPLFGYASKKLLA